MTRLSPRLLVILSAAIATNVFLLGASIPVHACPFADGNGTLNSLTRQPDASKNHSDMAMPNDSERRSSLDYMGVASLGAIAGLFAIALFYKARRSRHVTPTEVELLRRYPQLEHPEMMLTLIPQEALASTLNTEFVGVS